MEKLLNKSENGTHTHYAWIRVLIYFKERQHFATNLNLLLCWQFERMYPIQKANLHVMVPAPHPTSTYVQFLPIWVLNLIILKQILGSMIHFWFGSFPIFPWNLHWNRIWILLISWGQYHSALEIGLFKKKLRVFLLVSLVKKPRNMTLKTNFSR